MTPSWRRCALVVLIATLGFAVPAQEQAGPQPSRKEELRLPNGKLQKDEILKAEHAQNLKDAARLAGLARELQSDLEKEDRFVLSIATLKKTEDIEKLVKSIRTRLRHN